MRIHEIGRFTFLCLGATLAIGCSSGAGSGSDPGGPSGALSAVPAAGHAIVQGRAGRAGVRPLSVPTCSGLGSYAFVGGTNNNVAAGFSSGVLSGLGNQACDYDSGIGAGQDNHVSSGGSSSDSFIGAGGGNVISTSNAFIGAGSTIRSVETAMPQ